MRQSKPECMSIIADFSLERTCRTAPVCGVDEVGRGPWAGPLVAGAAILGPDCPVEGVADSKALSGEKREEIAACLQCRAEIGLGIVEVWEIDALGLTEANDLAMRRAIAGLPRRPAFALVDGKRLPHGLPCAARAVIRGDALSLSIAAASIVAKVARDRMMCALAADFPGYGWETNAGYGVVAHRKGLERFGVTPHHRRCFAPIRKILDENNAVDS